jgi:lysophospholipid acyltransferase (LPLAT)-like uncharacterized protein
MANHDQAPPLKFSDDGHSSSASPAREGRGSSAIAGKDALMDERRAQTAARRKRRALAAAAGKKAGGTDELRERVYGSDGLSQYAWRDRLIIRAAALVLSVAVRLVCSTLRWEVRGAEQVDTTLASGRRVIFTFWHTCIFTATWLWRKRGIVVMSSRSRDGEFTGRLIKRHGYGTARGSSSRGAGRALAEMAACLENGIDVAFTIDGPRGPAYVAKAGAVTLARHTGHAILPFYITTRRRIQIPSWDRLQIPVPFTRALALVSTPIYVSGDSTSGEIELRQAELQETLDRLRREAEEWRGSPG